MAEGGHCGNEVVGALKGLCWDSCRGDFCLEGVILKPGGWAAPNGGDHMSGRPPCGGGEFDALYGAAIPRRCESGARGNLSTGVCCEARTRAVESSRDHDTEEGAPNVAGRTTPSASASFCLARADNRGRDGDALVARLPTTETVSTFPPPSHVARFREEDETLADNRTVACVASKVGGVCAAGKIVC